MAASYLKKAQKLFYRKKYTQVIRMLEPQVFRYRENFDFYYMLGIACLQTGDYGGAFSYLRRSLSIKPLDENTLLALAVVHLKREEMQEAIRNWFSVLDSNPNNKIADRGLKYIKKISEDGPAVLFEQNRHLKLIPEKRSNPFPFILALAGGVLAVALAGLILSNVLKPVAPKRKVDADLSISAVADFVRNPENASIIMTEDEVKQIYKKAYNYFEENRDNMARRELNRLMLSNASAAIKNNAKIMIDYSKVPEFTDLETDFGYDEVNANPLLYNGCYVKWKGMISNLDISDERIAFDFLVGYHTRQVLEGIAVCISKFAISANNGEAFEILGQVAGSADGFYLRLIAYHKIIPETEE